MPTEPEFLLEREIRFALVMYGGVSLAVYINGVAQEFYRLVRSTAGGDVAINGEDLVYRRIAQILNSTGKIDEAGIGDTSPVRTRFVVDILSGTSAGGLNALFLAKALANGQDFSVLEKLWINQADISSLLNDKRSAINAPSGFTVAQQNPPQSLLNSERMYALLLSTLDKMDGPSQAPASVLVDEVDLFITTTDLRGRTVQVQLADQVVPERRFRSVFHFRRSPLLPKLEPPGESKDDGAQAPPRNDFVAKFNPFLAFAARCTSAFPIAFEPMRLKDIESVLERSAKWHSTNISSSGRDWQPFLVDYVEEDGPLDLNPDRFPTRAFADGGYLNNKPFSYAIEELGIRGGDLPYERKLVYIEPSPERINPESAHAEKPDLIDNSLDAAFTLPRYQTIREDLASVSRRNDLVRKIRNIVEELENDIDADPTLLTQWLPVGNDQYACTPLSVFIKMRGPLYSAYHRLKVKSVTHDIARFLISALELDDSSDSMRAAEYLVSAWREQSFAAEVSANHELESCFLSRYDLAYRERRLYFILSRLDNLYALDASATRVVSAAGLKEERLDAIRDHSGDFRADIRKLRGDRKFKQFPGLVNMLSNFRICRNEWLERGPANPLRPLLSPVSVRKQWKTSLESVLWASCEDCLTAARKELLNTPVISDTIQKAMQIMAEHNARYFVTCGHWAQELFPAGSKDLLKHCIRYFYDRYDFYDAATFPITYGTDVGILKTADVYRISPVDAVEIIDESRDEKRRKKLAGDSLSAFGAFFQDSWRENDIMWGRLDGSERIISMLLPGAKNNELRKRLIAQAHLSIITDTLQAAKVAEVQAAFVSGLMGDQPLDAQQSAKAAAVALLQPQELIEFLKNDFQVDRTYRPSWTIPIVARASRIVGQLLGFISDEREWNTPATALLARVSTLLWGVVQVAIPDSFTYASFRWFAGLLLFCEILLLVLGIWFSSQAIAKVASVALALTLILGVLVQLLHGYMSGERTLFRMLRGAFFTVCVTIGIAITVVGIHDLPSWILLLTSSIDSWIPDPLLMLGVSSAMAVVFGMLSQLPQFSKASRNNVPPGLWAPTIAMELSSSASQISAILPLPRDRNSMRLAQYIDFGVIAAYAVLFSALAVYEFSHSNSWRFVPVVAVFFGWFAAVFDIQENRSILQTLDLENSALTDDLISNTKKISLRKWSCITVAFLMFSPGLLFQDTITITSILAAILLLLAGVTGMIGLRRYKWLRVSMSLFSCVVLALLIESIVARIFL